MHSLSDIKRGMLVRGAEGALLGEVCELDGENFMFSSRARFSRCFLVSVNHVSGVQGDSVMMKKRAFELFSGPKIADELIPVGVEADAGTR